GWSASGFFVAGPAASSLSSVFVEAFAAPVLSAFVALEVALGAAAAVCVWSGEVIKLAKSGPSSEDCGFRLAGSGRWAPGWAGRVSRMAMLIRCTTLPRPIVGAEPETSVQRSGQ